MTPIHGESAIQIDLIQHKNCRHVGFRMTCAQFDALVAESGNRCQVCGIDGLRNPTRKLYLDHDWHVGDWAVRGLLCTACNGTLGIDHDIPRGERFQAFVANAWYRRALAAAGVAAEMPEPSGAVLITGSGGGRWALSRRDARNRRIKDGPLWVGPHRNSKPLTWKRLLYRYGPLNITPMHDR